MSHQAIEECPYDPQRFPAAAVVTHLMDAVRIATRAPDRIKTTLDEIYWQGVAVARYAHAYPSVQTGALVKRKDGVFPAPLITNVLRYGKVISDDRSRVVTRVFYIPDNGWCLQLDGEDLMIFPEDQFDLL